MSFIQRGSRLDALMEKGMEMTGRKLANNAVTYGGSMKMRGL